MTTNPSDSDRPEPMFGNGPDLTMEEIDEFILAVREWRNESLA